MRINKSLFFIALCFHISSFSLLKAEKKPSLGTKVYQRNINIATQTKFIEFAKNPSAEQSDEMLNLIKEIVDEPYFIGIKPEENFIIFLSIGGINQIVYIHQFFYGNTFADPSTVELFRVKNLWAIWITDFILYYDNSVEIEFDKLKSYIRMSSFQSSSVSPNPFGIGKEVKIQIGLHKFKVPFKQRINANISFIRRDKEAFERQTWERSYIIDNTPFSETYLGLFLPVQEMKGPKIRREIFLTMSIGFIRRITLERSAYNRFLFFTPKIIFGVGLPSKKGEREYLLGSSISVMNDLIDLSGSMVRSSDRDPSYQLGINFSSNSLTKILQGN